MEHIEAVGRIDGNQHFVGFLAGFFSEDSHFGRIHDVDFHNILAFLHHHAFNLAVFNVGFKFGDGRFFDGFPVACQGKTYDAQENQTINPINVELGGLTF